MKHLKKPVDDDDHAIYITEYTAGQTAPQGGIGMLFEKFGEFDSAEELNRAAAAQLAEGDIDAIYGIAEENGIDREDAEDYIDGAAPELCTPIMAALGKLKVGIKGDVDLDMAYDDPAAWSQPAEEPGVIYTVSVADVWTRAQAEVIQQQFAAMGINGIVHKVKMLA